MEWVKQVPIQEAGQSAWGEEDGLGKMILFNVLFEPELAEEIADVFSLFIGLRLRTQWGHFMEDKTSLMLHGFGM